MLSNSDIYQQLQAEVEQAISSFKSSGAYQELAHGFEQFETFDFAAYRSKVKEEIKTNLHAVWTNTARGIDPSQKLDAILLEYYQPDQENLEAFSYGIIDWEGKEVTEVEVDMGWSYDFADALEQNTGITLDFFNPYIDDFDDDEEYELMRCYLSKGLLAVHEAMMELHQENAFDVINKNDEFYFLLGEHDSDCYAILSIGGD